MKISITGVLVLGVAVLAVESKWPWASRKQKKLDRCFNYCKTNSNVRNELIKNICPDYCEGIDCSGHGSCNMGRCTCHDGFSGRYCETDLCDCVDCNDRGTCVAGICQCQEGFIEDRCNDVMCNNGGTCEDGICNCTAEFVGERCDMKCNTVKGPCSRRQFMVVGDVNFIPVSRTANIANVPDCEDLCNANPDCLGFEHDILFNGPLVYECLIFDVDISSVLIPTASDGTSGVCTACN